MDATDTDLLDGDQLAALIADQLAVLLRLRQMGQQQQQLIADGRVGELLSLLGQKQQVLQRLTELQQQLRPAHQQPASRRRWSSEQQRQQCQADSAQCTALLAEILQAEAVSETQLTASRDALGEQLQQSAGALHAARAYRGAQHDGGHASRLDLSSGG